MFRSIKLPLILVNSIVMFMFMVMFIIMIIIMVMVTVNSKVSDMCGFDRLLKCLDQ